MSKPLVGIVMGSDSDLPVMKSTVDILQYFDVPFETTIASAHRTPKKVSEYAQAAEKRGIKVIIAGAGGAAHLAGVIASETVVPVIGVPIDSSPLRGIDALLSIAQMPGGIPVATMAIGKGGARNAALLAIQIMAIEDEGLREKIRSYREDMAKKVEEKDRRIKENVHF